MVKSHLNRKKTFHFSSVYLQEFDFVHDKTDSLHVHQVKFLNKCEDSNIMCMNEIL